ncbi:hypothetical protein Tco_0732280 [Tanacetum coccineum]
MITNNNRIEGKKPLGLMLSPQLRTVGIRYSKKDKNNGKTDETEHGIGKSVKYQSRRRTYLLRTNPGPLNGLGQLTTLLY